MGKSTAPGGRLYEREKCYTPGSAGAGASGALGRALGVRQAGARFSRAPCCTILVQLKYGYARMGGGSLFYFHPGWSGTISNFVKPARAFVSLTCFVNGPRKAA